MFSFRSFSLKNQIDIIENSKIGNVIIQPFSTSIVMVLTLRAKVSFFALIDLYILSCSGLSKANQVNTSIGLNGKQGNNVEQHSNAFWNISDENYDASGRKASSSIISDNRGVNKAKIGNLKF